MLAAERLSRILSVVYRAATEPESWPLALSEISDAVESSISGLLVQHKTSGAIPLAVMDPRSPLDALDEYIRYYGAIDELRRFAIGKTAGEVIADTMPAFSAIAARSETYHDFYEPWQMGHFVGGCIVNDEAQEGTLIVYRGGSATFSDEQLTLIEMILPHVKRAIQIGSYLAEAGASTEVFGGALDSLSAGIIFLDRAARVMWMNRSAREMVAHADGIRADKGELRCGNPAADAALRRLVRAAVGSLGGLEPVHVSVPRPSGKQPYVIVASAVDRPADDRLPFRAAIMVVITDRARSSRLAVTHLRHVYALTTAEANLASALADGTTLQQYAEEHCITVATVRTQLKRAMEKTNTHRQSELVNLVLTSPAAMLQAR